MHRINGAGHQNGTFVAEDPATNRPPTEVTAQWLNAVQQEICGVIESVGIELSSAQSNQLLAAIKKLPLDTLSVEECMGVTGDMNSVTKGGFFLTTIGGLLNLPDGWSNESRYQLLVIPGLAYVQQIIFDANVFANTNRIAWRRLHGGDTWSPWVEIVKQGDALKNLSFNECVGFPEDMDLVTVGGFYLTGASELLHIPDGWNASKRYQLQMIPGENYAQQIIFDASESFANKGRMAWRRWNVTEGWSAWVEFIKSGDPINGTPIGTTERSTGAFLTLTNESPNGIAVGADLNTINTGGWFITDHSAVGGNYPPGFSNPGRLLLHVSSGGAYLTQTAYQASDFTASDRIFTRRYRSGIWSAWSELAHQGDSIKINGTASADPNTVDFFEKNGQFTPYVYGRTTAGVGTYSVQKGYHTAIGDRCFFDLTLAWSAHTGTGDLLIGGIPFTTSNASQCLPPLSVSASNLTFTGQLTAIVPNGNVTYLELIQIASNVGHTNVQMDASVSHLRLAGHYRRL